MSRTTHPSLSFATPYQQGNVNVKNRFFKSAMSEQLGDKQHNPGKRLAKLYRTWSAGGTGLLITGNVMIDRAALGEPKNVVLDNESDLESFIQWADAAKQNDTKVWMQLNHPGKQSPTFLTKQPVAPSAIPLGGGLENTFATPRALEESEILEIIEKFATAAKLAKQTGFDGVQIHGAHGYLVSQFLSPHHNQRKDKWGGSLQNRMRFVLEVYRAIREATDDNYPIGIKLNSADYSKGGFSHEESMEVVETLAKAGIDLLEISGGTYESPSMVGHNIKESTRRREAYFIEYADKIRERVSIPLVVTGGFRSGSAMLQALKSGATDFIGLARPLSVYPDFPNELIANPEHKIDIPKPSTGVKFIDKMTMLDITWYESQLARLSKGKQAIPDQTAWISVAQTLSGLGVHAFTKRRA
ncbi:MULTISPECIES: NADH:flavin oxidoreductase/NADH oxidase family protein [unclassified Oleiphilus]|nr:MULTISPECIES: NADH:flavin oxidoreductase/NADH oxidase family protein [unclassified Oleiphilus]KZY40352.1 NADH oxidase [Oleiphilus sp. HI0050]KZY81294.1 NADH oxidase [Oleiphilus sp. HI0069]KZY83893.1 NADH oxidase [Oleiphilus sp. HI0068]KZZ21235.1 NADH oxidase [Oleiphilus sp. HI0081]KZY51831.1 NADH oxidase [Oleiphilus sp. HI0061]